MTQQKMFGHSHTAFTREQLRLWARRRGTSVDNRPIRWSSSVAVVARRVAPSGPALVSGDDAAVRARAPVVRGLHAPATAAAGAAAGAAG